MSDILSKIARLRAENERLVDENRRFRRGLQIIIESGPIYGGAWAKAQAHGHLHDLDFDGYPLTGRPETEPSEPSHAR